MFLAALFTRAPGDPPPSLPPLPEGSAEPVPGTLSFRDMVAGLNPLHHLPVVGMIYREATGEYVPPVVRVVGGGLLGGPLGMLSSALMAALDEFRGKGAPPATPPANTPPRETAPPAMIAGPGPTPDGLG